MLTTATQEKLDRSYRPDIDGIRALAILSVVLYHANVPLLTGGFTGVDVFFVLSGYLIGGHIFSELQADRFSYLRFYQRRAKRILPAFYVVLAFVIAGIVLLLSPLNAYLAAYSGLAATLSISNVQFWQSAGYFAPKSELNPLLMTWSLGVEEQFYFVIPLLMVLLARVRRSWMLPSILVVCVISFVFAVWALPDYPNLVFYLLPSRAWELGVGVALAVFELSRGRYTETGALAQAMSVAGFAGIALPFFLLNRTTPFPGAAALPTVLGTALVLAVPQSWISRKLLSLPPLVYIGRISYSWYLWHWPLLAFLRVVYAETTPPLMVSLAAIALAFGLAVASYYLIEQPFRRSKRPPVPLLIRYAAVTFVFLVLWVVVGKTHGFGWRYPQLNQMEAVIDLRGVDPCLADDGEDQPNLSPGCYDPSKTQPSVALWGDSHGGALAPGLRPIAIQSGYGFVQLTKLGCLPLIGAVRYTPSEPMETAECIRFNQKSLEVIKADPQIRIVVLAGFWANPFRRSQTDQTATWLTADLAHEHEIPTLEASRSIFEQALTATVRSLQAAGKQVVVLGDTPSYNFEPIWRVARVEIPAQHALARWLHVSKDDDSGYATPGFQESDAYADAALRETLAAIPGVTLAELRQSLCKDPDACIYRDGDRLLYGDSHHLTPDGAGYALRAFHLTTPGGLRQ